MNTQEGREPRQGLRVKRRFARRNNDFMLRGESQFRLGRR